MPTISSSSTGQRLGLLSGKFNASRHLSNILLCLTIGTLLRTVCFATQVTKTIPLLFRKWRKVTIPPRNLWRYLKAVDFTRETWGAGGWTCPGSFD